MEGARERKETLVNRVDTGDNYRSLGGDTQEESDPRLTKPFARG